MHTVIDVETTFIITDDGKSDNSPKNSSNKLVSVGIGGEPGLSYYCMNHKFESATKGAKETIQSILNHTTLLIGHNIKYDLIWLKECGFQYEGKIWCTMIGEYVFSRGVTVPLDLSSCCERYGIPTKLDIVKIEYWKKGVNTDEIPWDVLEEYGENDVIITDRLFKKQRELVYAVPS